MLSAVAYNKTMRKYDTTNQVGTTQLFINWYQVFVVKYLRFDSFYQRQCRWYHIGQCIRKPIEV